MSIRLFKFRCDSSVEEYDIVSYSETSGLYEKCNNSSDYIGVVKGTLIVDGLSYALIAFNGTHQARVSRDVSIHGGSFGVENGRVFVEAPHNSHYRYILPTHPSEEGVSDGSLLMGNLAVIIF